MKELLLNQDGHGYFFSKEEIIVFMLIFIVLFVLFGAAAIWILKIIF